MTTDPKTTILDLIEAGWTLTWSPTFSADWFDRAASMPQVIVTHIRTHSEFTGLSENPSSASRRFTGVYAVDVWSDGDEEKRWQMVDEVDRIIASKCDSPGGSLTFIEATGTRDLDEGSIHPRLYRSQITIEVLYYD